mgnify:FL=1
MNLHRGSQITSSGAISLTGSGLSAAATSPITALDLLIGGSVNAQQNVGLRGDRIQIDPSTGQVVSGAGARLAIVPFSVERAIVIGGSDEASVLNVTQEELARLKAGGLIEIGGTVYTGGITLKGPVTIDPASAPLLSLVTADTATISQTAGSTLTVPKLAMVSGSIALPEANMVQAVSARASQAAGIVFTDAAPVVSVDNLNGIGDLAAQSGGTRYPVTLNFTARGASVTQNVAAIRGSDVQINGLGGTGNVTLRDVAASGSLTSSGWSATNVNGVFEWSGTYDAGNAQIVVNAGGALSPGGAGVVAATTLKGNLQMNTGSLMKIDADATGIDSITIPAPFAVNFQSGVTVAANAIAQPAPNTYGIVNGSTTGTLPGLAGNLANASLAFGSLKLVVASAPAPPPAPRRQGRSAGRAVRGSAGCR